MFDDFEYLPLSENKIKIYKDGRITVNGISQIPSGSFDRKVLLNWLGKTRHYSVIDLYAATHCKVHKDPYLLRHVEGYLTTDTFSNPEDICYRFKGMPLESLDRPGYYHIPFYNRYVISNCGEVIDLKYNKRVSVQVFKKRKEKNIRGGYLILRATSDIFDRTHSSVHRLMGLAFKKCEGSPWVLVINHKDGKGENNVPDNLEWVTRGQNNQHAYDSGLLANKVVAVDYMNFFTGEKKTFPTMVSLSRHIQMSESFVYDRMTRSKFVLFPDGHLVKPADGSEWPVIDGEVTGIKNSKRQISLFNIVTGLITTVESIAEASSVTSLESYAISHNCKQKNFGLYKNYFFKFLEDDRNWPVLSMEQVLYLTTVNKLIYSFVEVTDLTNGLVERFLDYEEASKQFNVTQATIYKRTKKNVDPVTGKQFRSIRF